MAVDSTSDTPGYCTALHTVMIDSKTDRHMENIEQIKLRLLIGLKFLSALSAERKMHM